jgi:hypothetical protein
MLQRTVNKHKTNWHHMLFSALWAYRTAVKTATGFTPFHLVHGVKATLPIECEIPTLRTAIELLPDTAPMEQRLLNLESLDEDRRSSLQNNEAAKKRSKATFDRHVNLRSFREGDLVLAYDIAHDTFGHGQIRITLAWPLHHPALPHQRRIHPGLPRRPHAQGTRQWVIPQEILCLNVVKLL